MARVNEEVEHSTGEVQKYRRHPNGRGWVSPGAVVAPSTFDSEMAYVESGAEIGEESWIGPGSWIDHGARLGKRVFVGANVRIGERSKVGSGARVGSHTKLGNDVEIGALARLERDTTVADGGSIAASSRAWATGAPATRPYAAAHGRRQSSRSAA
jgi:UDP-3-O-[3-hydroxymyristoyl] glucosamine N-acyltransferase